MPRETPRWLFFWSFLGVLFLSGVLLKCYWPDHGLYDVTGYLLGRDFVNVWMASHLLLQQNISTAYDIHAFIAAMRGMFGHGLPFHNWSYPPTILPFIAPFSLLPYSVSLAVWSAIGLVLFILASRTNGIAGNRLVPALLLATSPASLVNLLSGQNGFFTAACFLGGFYLLPRRPLLAGVLFGLLTLKPHLGILIPFALLLLGQWRTIAAAASTTCLLVAASIGLWGTPIWHSYFTDVASYQHELLLIFKGFYAAMMPGPYAAARVVGIPHGMAMPVHLLVTFIAAFTSLRILSREGTTPRAILALALAAILITPYGYNYDLTIVTGALLAYLSTTDTTAREHMLFGLVWLLPAATFAIMFAHMPVAPLFLLAPLLYLERKSATRVSSA